MAEIYKFEPASDSKKLTEVFRDLGVNLDTRCAEIGKCGGCSIDLLSGELINIHTGEIVRGRQRVYACLHALSPVAPAEISVPEKSIISGKSSAVSRFKIVSELLQSFGERDIGTQKYGVAIDIGTTTVAVMLVKLEGAEIAGVETAFNGQIKYGDNVLTRIKHCQSDVKMVKILQQEIMDVTILPLLLKLLQQSGLEFTDLAEIVIAGNTTMLHLCAGVNPETIGVSPFTPVFTGEKILTAAEIFNDINTAVTVRLLPSISAYLGADVYAGALISGVLESHEPVVIVDVGTNGEMILNTGSGIAGCSTAAGPAFEGAGLSSGTRAAHGAISHFNIGAGAVETEIIGGGSEAVGICGTAYFDFLAAGVREGLLAMTGRFTDKFRQEYEEFVCAGEGGGEFYPLGVKNRDGVKITEGDVSSLLQAKAAVAAGLETMLNRYDLEAGDLKKVYLAGGFGMYLDVEAALLSGLLPEVELSQVELVGNTSLAGAYAALEKTEISEYLGRLAPDIEVVELNLDEDFEDTYIDNMLLPC